MWPSRWNKLFVLSLLFLMFFVQLRSSEAQPVVSDGGSISDAAYGAGWNGDTTAAPSKNAVYDKIETLGGGHDPVSLDANADTLLSLSTQEIGLDTQAANCFWSGPESGIDAVPTCRAVIDDDIPNTITIDLAATATALAADPANCSATQAAGGITAAGVAEACIDLAATYQSIDADLTTLAGSTAWRLFYSNGTSVITELALGTSGQSLTSQGATAAPAFANKAAGNASFEATEIATDGVDAIADIASAIKSGIGTKITTQTGVFTSGNCIETDGNGDLVDSGAPCGTASPGGSNTQVQFNDASAFGGDAGFTYNKTTDTATIGNISVPSGGTITVAANATDGDSLTQCEDTDVGSDCVKLGVGQTNLPAGTTTHTWGTDGKLPSSAIGSMVKSIYWPAGALSSDGTNCADPTEATINSGPKQYTIICTDNDASRIHGMVVMPDGWNAGTVTFEVAYVQTAADTAVLNMDVAAACRGVGETINSTYGTEVAIDDAAVTGSSGVDMTTSAAVTANGTCAAGDLLYWHLDIDATGTTTAVATLHFLGVKMEYTWTPED